MEWDKDPRKTLRASEVFDLAAFDTGSTPGFSGDKAGGQELMAERGKLLAELQERLYAQGRMDKPVSLLIVLQGIDTAGKGGIARHVMGMVDPQGVEITGFGVPTPEEAAEHFLWRIRKALPKPGRIGIFDRSHYEDVLVQRVEHIVEEPVWRKRYDVINEFEKELVDSGTTVLKFAHMISHDEQGARLMSRLDRPDKRWKYATSDLKTRAKWDEYQEAYADVFRYTSTDIAPWYVIPSDRKWFSRLAVTEIVTRTMVDMRLKWPKATFDVEEQRRLLAETMTLQGLESSLARTREEVQEAIDDSCDVRQDVMELRGGGERGAERARRQRRKWEAELEDTIAQKEAIIEQRRNG